jgi:hypothetical protein
MIDVDMTAALERAGESLSFVDRVLASGLLDADEQAHLEAMRARVEAIGAELLAELEQAQGE